MLGPLLEAGAARVTIANRTAARAVALVDEFVMSAPAQAPAVGAPAGPATPLRERLRGCGFDGIGSGFDLVVNATSAGLAGERLPIDDAVLAGAALAYDMFYSARETAFVAQSRAAGCPRACDGLGMLVEQAAESFLVWRGVRPLTAPVYEALRAELAAGRLSAAVARSASGRPGGALRVAAWPWCWPSPRSPCSCGSSPTCCGGTRSTRPTPFMKRELARLHLRPTRAAQQRWVLQQISRHLSAR